MRALPWHGRVWQCERMTRPTTSTIPSLQLFALTQSGPRSLPVAASTGTMHDVMDVLPDGVYSALRTFQHERFLDLEAHVDRTDRSMAGLGWTKTVPRELLRTALARIVREHPAADTRVRFDVLPAEHELHGVRADVFIGVSPHSDLDPRFVEEGVRVEIARHLERREPRIKTTAFVRTRRPLPIGTQDRFEGILLDPRGRILECSSSNIAFVRGTEVIAAGDGVLEGITLQVVVRQLASLGLRPRFERLDPAELKTVDEAFLTSSIRGVVPVVQVEDVSIGGGRVGPRTRAIVEAYYAAAAREACPAAR